MRVGVLLYMLSALPAAEGGDDDAMNFFSFHCVAAAAAAAPARLGRPRHEAEAATFYCK